MKKLGIYIIANLVAIWAITLLLTGVKVTGGFLAYLILALIISLVNWGVKPILTFLTLPFNFLTLGLLNIIIDIVLFYVISLVIPGYEITAGEFIGIDASIFVIPAWHTSLLVTIVIGALLLSLMAGLIEWLLKDNQS